MLLKDADKIVINDEIDKIIIDGEVVYSSDIYDSSIVYDSSNIATEFVA